MINKEVVEKIQIFPIFKIYLFTTKMSLFNINKANIRMNLLNINNFMMIFF